MIRIQAALLAAAVSLACAGAAEAGTYSVTATEGLSGGWSFNTLNTNPYTVGSPNVASASFTYSGPLTFDDTQSQNSTAAGDLNTSFGFSTANVSNYSGAGSVSQGGTTIANFSSLANYLASSGSASGYQYGSYYTFDLGTLAAGTVLTVSHDDGISIYQGSSQIGSTVSGPTTQVTDTVTIGKMGDTILYYSRQNGTPSILNVAVPEPMSLSLMAAGLIGVGVVRRRKSASTGV